MADRPIVNLNDLRRLIDERLLADEKLDPSAWLAREGMEPEALVAASRFMVETWRAADPRSATVDFGAAVVLVLGAFQFGWDAHRDLRGERDDGT